MEYIDSQKIKKIEFTKNNFYVAIDFDKTITNENSFDSWDASGYALGNEYKEESNRNYKKYSPIELQYDISYEEKSKAMVEWYSSAMRLYYKYNLTEKKLIESINKSKLEFRDGAKEFLDDMHNKNIPVIILSAGIGNVIKLFLEKNGCYYDNITIISNFISFDQNGNIEKLNDDMIHTLNKNLNLHMTEEIAQKIEGKKYRLLFGDFVEDKNMVPKNEWDQTVSVGFLCKKVEENLEVFKNNFDVVLTGKDASFRVANELIGYEKN